MRMRNRSGDILKALSNEVRRSSEFRFILPSVGKARRVVCFGIPKICSQSKRVGMAVRRLKRRNAKPSFRSPY